MCPVMRCECGNRGCPAHVHRACDAIARGYSVAPAPVLAFCAACRREATRIGLYKLMPTT